MRPTYLMLTRHAWLAPLLKPPTISEDEEAEAAAEAGGDLASISDQSSFEGDREVAEWVTEALERKRSGKMAISEKPALHAAPLDAVPGSPMKNEMNTTETADLEPPPPNPGVRVDSPELISAKISSLDFASGVRDF